MQKKIGMVHLFTINIFKMKNYPRVFQYISYAMTDLDWLGNLNVTTVKPLI